MVRVFSSRISAAKLFDSQRTQYAETLVMTGTCPAGAGTLARVAVSNLGHFLCLKVTGNFSTLVDVGGAVIYDDGVDHLRGQLIDGAAQRKLFSDFIPFALFLSPGRRRDATAVNAFGPVVGPPAADASGPSGSLFYPTELEYLFSANSEIQLDVRNDSNTAQRFDLAFHGIRILSGVSVAGVKGV